MSKLKKVDYSCLVGSQVLMEFWDDHQEFKQTGFMVEYESITALKVSGCDSIWYDNCRIYRHPDYWMSNINGDLVLPEGLNINFKYFHDGDTHFGQTEGGCSIFKNGNCISTIDHCLYLQVTGAAEGYEL